MTRGRTHRPVVEVEVKARITDIRGLRRALKRAGARLEFRGRMADRRYDRRRDLIRRDEVLRLRTYRPAGRGKPRAVLTWKGAATERDRYRHRPELELDVPNSAALHAVFTRLRYRVTLAIDRRVEVYRLGRATLRLERYPRMDTLLEIEGPPPAIERAIAATGLPRARFLTKSLPYFTGAYRRRTGRSARLADRDP
jgi:predicted adenylyl cyclase CyaB